MSSYYRQQLESWLKEIEVKANRVLDIGGGAKPVKGRTGSWDVKEYLILDNNAEGEFNPDFEIDLNEDIKWDGDVNGFVGETNVRIICEGNYPREDELFDVVFMLEVAEYLYDPLKVLCFISQIMRTKGVVYISFPSIYPVHNPKEIDYLRYTRKGVEKLLKVAGFSSWEIIPRVATKGKMPLSDFYAIERMHPVKNDNVIFDIGYMVKAIK